jgi:adenine-specific DNA methylase/very-short-patch-repair endonuclease
MTARRKLIEVALPLDAINAASAREKSIRHGHPSTLHLWWARRPLAAARAVIFAQMVDDPSSVPEEFPTPEAQERERQRLFHLIEELVQWENTTNEAVLARARAEIWKSWRRACADNAGHPRAAELFDPDKLPAFHDPFAGGGALPLEAQRLGLEAYASDLNPVAVLINKAMIEIPPRFAGRPPVHPSSGGRGAGGEGELFPHEWRGAQGLAEDVRYYGQWMRDEAEKRIGHLYPKIEITREMVEDPVNPRPDLKPYVGRKLTVIAWLWARTVKSPNPAFAHVDVPLASTFMLSTKPGKEAYVEPVITPPSPDGRGAGDEGGYRFTVKVGKPKDMEAAKNGTKLARGANFRCLMSGTPIASEHIYAEANAGRMGARLMAIIAEGDRGRVYLAPTLEHEAAAQQAKPEWKPEVAMPENPRWFSPPLYGLTTYGDLFTPRQLVALTTFSELVGEAMEKVKADYLEAMRAPTPAITPTPALPLRGMESHPSPQRGEVGRGELQRGDVGRGELQRGDVGRGELQRGDAETGDPQQGESAKSVWQPTPVPPALLQAARALRKNMTSAEQLLWRCLRGKQLAGFRFRKQHPIERFVLDFYCPSARLAIELDGSQHATEEGKARDAERTAFLEQRGIRVLRFWNREVFQNLEGVLTSIWAALHEAPRPHLGPHPSHHPHPSPSYHPHPSPPPTGEGVTPLPPAGGGWEGGTRGGWEGGTPAGGGQDDDETPLRDGGTGAQAYAEAVGVYLGLGVDRLADRSSTICGWDIGFTKIRNTFGRQALPMTWDYAEGNPFSDSTGNFGALLEWVEKFLAESPAEPSGYGVQQDASAQAVSTDKLVSTDPPYYDNIGYADLSDFFYVWLRRSLKDIFPDLFATLAVPKAEELVATPYRHGSKEKAETFFLDGMTRAMHRLAEQAHPAFPVTIYYAFKQSESESDEGTASTGWETFLERVPDL